MVHIGLLSITGNRILDASSRLFYGRAVLSIFAILCPIFALILAGWPAGRTAVLSVVTLPMWLSLLP